MKMADDGKVLSFEDHLPLIKASTQLALRIEFLRGRSRSSLTGKVDRKVQRRLKLALVAYDALEQIIKSDNEDALSCLDEE